MAYGSTLSLRLQAQRTGSLDIEQLASTIDRLTTVIHTDGTGANQATVMWSDTRTLSSGSSESLDLSGSSLQDAFGANIALTTIKGIILYSNAANTVNLTIGNVTNGLATIFGAATQSLTLHPGELLVKWTPNATGYAVTAGTADLLKITNGAASSVYDVIIIGN